MNRIQYSNIAATIGNVRTNLSGRADDLTLNSNSKPELQILTDIAVDSLDMERHPLQPIKSIVVEVEPKKTMKNTDNEYSDIFMKNIKMKMVKSTTHHGIKRGCSIQESRGENVEENIKQQEELFTV